jgi:calcineurin-like phosphoesterase family protein
MLIQHFYSDPHFGHPNILKYTSRPFANTDEMDAAFIARYNERVQPGEVVLWCGDCSFDLRNFPSILRQMNGHKILIRGNHDKSKGVMAKMGFDVVLDELVLRIGRRTCRVSHYPYAGSSKRGDRVDERYLNRRPPRHKGEVLIHGHTHSPHRRDGNMVHVGVDAWDYRPASMVEVEALVLEV